MTFLFTIGFLEVTIWDVLDILLVAVLLFQIYKLVRGTLATYILFGFILVYLTALIVRALEMELLARILGGFIGVGAIALIIVFQTEIRRFLLILGRRTVTGRNWRLLRLLKKNDIVSREELNLTSNAIVESLGRFSDSKTGALIVIKGSEDLGEILKTGKRIDSDVSVDILESIFFKNGPLHDGAVVISGDRIVAAKCILPVSKNEKVPENMGLRHRAALGISESCDATVLTVSEETGDVCFIMKGYINDHQQPAELQELIVQALSRSFSGNGISGG